MAFDLPADYKQVPERIADLKAKHPEASLQPVDPLNPFSIVTIGGREFVVYTAACYRTPDDPRPGIGIAWEPFPGKTPYTKDSEMMNAETSAWGRAIVAALASESKAIASAEEVRNRQADADAPKSRSRSAPAAPATTRRPAPAPANGGPTCATCSRPVGTDPVARSGGVIHHRACLTSPAPVPPPPSADNGPNGSTGAGPLPPGSATLATSPGSGPREEAAAEGADPAAVASPGDGPSPKQLGLIAVLLSKLGIPDSDRHRYVSALVDVDPPVTSMKHLTRRQTSRAIDALTAEAGEPAK